MVNEWKLRFNFKVWNIINKIVNDIRLDEIINSQVNKYSMEQLAIDVGNGHLLKKRSMEKKGQLL